MKKLFKRGSYNSGHRPGGADIGEKTFLKRNGGSIPPNLLRVSGTESNSAYLRFCRQYNIEVNPARYPVAVAEFFVKLLTRKGDVVLDPFAGSNATGAAAERQGRGWLAFDIHEPYLRGSQFRFRTPQQIGLVS
jgi:site-specific DNA-methyltransferase (cytosine-N4-specific)